MADDADVSLDEKRVHGDRRRAERAVVASPLGLATVDVSDDQIGRFGLAHRLDARDVAGGGRLAVATDEDVLVGDADLLERTGFGPATAVGFRRPANRGGDLLAASAGGRVGRLPDRSAGGDPSRGWERVGQIEGDVRAVDGEYLAASDGVHRAGEDLTPLGLEDVRDVADAGPYAATPDGLFRLDGEWTMVLDGDATLVASDGLRAHAVVDGQLVEHSDGEWVDAECPASDVVAVAHGEATYAVTAEGTFLVDPATAKDGATGWRSRELGLSDVAGLAIV